MISRSLLSRTFAAEIETSQRSATSRMSFEPAGDFAENGNFTPNSLAHSADHARNALAGIRIAPLIQPACHSVQSLSGAVRMFSR